jgi:hypothetical protein
VDGDGVTLTLTEGGATTSRVIRARALVGADGSSSRVARLLRGQPARDEDRIIAVRGYFDGIVGPPDQVELYFGTETFPGYSWFFPTSPAAANIGVGMVLETLPRTTDHLRDLMLRLIQEDRALNARLQGARLRGKVIGWPLSTYNPRVPIVGERILLAGDAAGLINPLNGEGIQYALLSGRWAAEILADCAIQDDFSQTALWAYAQRVQRELRYDMALSRLIVQVIRNRSLNPLWLQVLRIIVARACMDPIYAGVTGGIMAGLVPASSAMSGKIIGSTMQQAAMGMGVGTVKHLVQGPGHVTKIGLDTARLGLEVVATAAQHPGEFIRWGLGVAACSAELGAQVARHALMPREASRYPHEFAGGRGSRCGSSPHLRLTMALLECKRSSRSGAAGHKQRVQRLQIALGQP